MLKAFEVCFYTGVIFTVASFILSHISDITHIGGHIDAGDVDTDIEIHAEGAHFLTVSPVKPIVLASFVTVFGGIGMICLNSGLSARTAAIVAALSGLVVAYALYRFVVVPLYMAQNTSAVSQKELVGSIARTTLAIKGNGFGRIKYQVCGNIYSAPAKSVNGEDITRGANVVIIDIRKNIFYIKEIRGGM